MSEFKEQFRTSLSNHGKIRNRTEAHLVQYAERLLAEPVAMTLEQVGEDLEDELQRHMYKNPSHGWCRVSAISVGSRVMGKPHIVTRHLAIYGRGRGIYTLLISETVQKDALNNYAPRA